LSGGERGRLALAILALEGANFLLLDEPTNHLDIPAQEVLQEGLERFEGTLLLVSHDRYLVDRLATQIWELRAGRLRVFNGTYQEWIGARERETRRAREAATQAREAARAPQKQQGVASQKTARTQAEAERALATLEARIAELEAALAQCGQQLEQASAAGQVAEIRRLGETYTTTQAAIDALMAEWEALAR